MNATHTEATMHQAPRFTLTIEGEEPQQVDLEEFLADNAEGIGSETQAACRALESGQQVVGGGGAAPGWVLKRER